MDLGKDKLKSRHKLVYQTGNASSNTVVARENETKIINHTGNEPSNTVVASGNAPNQTNHGKEKECELGCKITMIDIANRSKKFIFL